MSDFESIQRLLEKHRPPPKPRLPDPVEIRLLSIRQVLKKRRGRGKKLPEFAVRMMKTEYDRLGSCEAVGRHIGISGRCVQKHFHKRKIKFRERPAFIIYKGTRYAQRPDGYYRSTGRVNQHRLHIRAWEERHGPLNGNRLIYLSDNYADVSDANLKMLTPKEFYLHLSKLGNNRNNEKAV